MELIIGGHNVSNNTMDVNKMAYYAVSHLESNNA